MTLTRKDCLSKFTVVVSILCISASSVLADKSKNIDRHIQVNQSQKIDISDFPSSKISVKGWDKQEIYIAVKVKISASDEDYETQFIDSIKIQESSSQSNVTISLKDNAPEENDNQFNFFGLKFGSYFKKDFSVEIYVPSSNILAVSVKYSTLTIEGIRGELHILGKSNSLTVADCSLLKEVADDYGSIVINNCKSSKFTLSTRSGSLQINNFQGAMEINAPYCSVKMKELGAGAIIKGKSSTIDLADIGGDVTVESSYSTISLTEIKGRVWVTSKSGVVSLKRTGSATVNADYSTVDFREIRGDSSSINATTRSGVIRIDDASGKVEIDAPYSRIALRKVTGEVAVTTQSGKISMTQTSGKINIKADHSTVISRSTEANSIWLNGKSNSIEFSCARLPKNTVILNEYGTTSMTIPSGFTGLLNLEAQQGRIETNLNLPDNARGATVFRGELGNSSETITIKSGMVRLFQI